MASNFLVILLEFFKRISLSGFVVYLLLIINKVSNVLFYKNYFNYVLCFILINSATFSISGSLIFLVLFFYVFKSLLFFSF